MKKRNPWSWIPTLYIAEGLPNVVVMTVAVVMYMQLGLTDTDIASIPDGWDCRGSSNHYGARLSTSIAPNAGGYSPCNCC